jgi:ATP-dependent Clp protease adaptor protein ClpS
LAEENHKGQLETREEVEIIEPILYRVIIHNDHYTTMEFVIEVLLKVFNKSGAEATKLMLDVHHQGRGVAGIYTLDIARTKVRQVEKMAKEREYPLKCTYEKA